VRREARGHGGSKRKVYYSYATQTKEVTEIAFPAGVTFTWDSFWRAAYMKANVALQRQANLLIARGAVTLEEAKQLVEVQRNALVQEFRKPLTPFGRLYSEILKPSRKLPTLKELLQKKGSIEAVLRSVGGTRQAVNRLTMVTRLGGPATISIEVALSVVVVTLAPENERELVGSRQIGGAIGSVGGMLGGAWAGCASLATLASPSLVVPVVGEISTGSACFIGGVLGGLGIGAIGRWGGERIGEAVYWRLVGWDWLDKPSPR
jgi:hypothetical protein